jgi:glycosyltransferase involved in cell wall biosynthesis
LKVLTLFKTYLPDSFTGIERVIWQIAEGTYPFGVQTDVLTLSRSPKSAPFSVDHHTVHQAKLDLYVASSGLSLSAFARFRELARSADVIHYQFPWPMADLLHFHARHGKPTVLTYHSDIVRQKWLLPFYRPLMMRFLQSVDHIVATSPNYLESSPILAQFRDKVSVIPIGLGTAPPVAADRVQAWRERLGSRFFLFVGVLRYYKGLPDLLKAAEQTGLPVVIAGDGPLGHTVASATAASVKRLGQVGEDDKIALIEACSAFVFPSAVRTEAFGIALAEAARAGKPMISCEIGTGTSYINKDGETGFVVPPNDPNALGSAMQRLWEDDDLRLRMGSAATTRFNTLFRAEDMARAYAQLYARLVERHRAAAA